MEQEKLEIVKDKLKKASEMISEDILAIPNKRTKKDVHLCMLQNHISLALNSLKKLEK